MTGREGAEQRIRPHEGQHDANRALRESYSREKAVPPAEMTEAASQPSQKAAEEHAHIAEARIGPPDPIVASWILLLGFTMAEW